MISRSEFESAVASKTPIDMWCRKTKQPVSFVVGVDTCPHCGARVHGADLSKLKTEIERLKRPLPCSPPDN